MRTLQIDPVNPDPAVIIDAAMYIKLGRLVAHPTDTLYGLAAHIGIAAAVQRIFDLKQRDERAPLPVLIGDPEQLEPLVSSIPAAGRILMETFWPGALTIAFPAAESLNPVLIGFGRTVGVRLPDHQVSRELCRQAKTPITSTSINRQGEAPATQPSNIDPLLLAQIDCLLDGGAARSTESSTVVDVSVEPARVVREGVISAGQIAAVITIEESSSDT